MRIRMLHGRMAGEVQDVPFHIALVLLADGRAQRLDEPADEPAPYETRPAEVMAEPIRKRGRRAWRRT